MERLVLRGTSHEHLLADLHQCELLGDPHARRMVRALHDHGGRAPARWSIGRLMRVAKVMSR